MKKRIIFSVLAVAVAALGFSTAWANDYAITAHLSDADLMIGMVGMIVDKSTIIDFFIGLKTIFNNALKAKTGDWQKTAMEVPSNTKTEDYKWLERFPKMRLWIGEKFIKSLKAGNYKVTNQDWEATIEVDRNDLDDDTSGHYSVQAQSAGDSAGELNDIILNDLKNSAFTGLCIDGQFFYDTDHEVNGSSVSNKLVAPLSSANRAAADASIGAARTMMGKFTDSEGMPLRLKGNLLEVGPALLATANILANADKLDDGSTNPYQGTFEVLENPGLISDTQWMLHNTRQAVKPFIIQVRKRPVFVSQTSMENDDVFNKRLFKFGSEARAAGVYGFWQLSVGSTGEG
jgi:phage major head subunit gpT-like protein